MVDERAESFIGKCIELGILRQRVMFYLDVDMTSWHGLGSV